MNLRPTILDRYLFKEFVMAFVAVVAFCTLLLLVASIFDRFGDILESGAPMSTIIVFFLAALPAKLMQIIPIASMLAVLFSIGSLARTNEILAMLTNGVHALRLSVPILVGGVFIVIGTFVMNEYVVPPLERMSKLYEKRLEDKDIREVTMNENVFTRGRTEWYYIARVYSGPDKQMLRPTVVNITPEHNAVKMRIEAEKATYLRDDPENDATIWEFENTRIWHFDDEGNPTTYTVESAPMEIALESDLPTILSQQMKPEEMNYHQLNSRIDILDAREQPTHNLRTDLLHKLTFPVGILIIMLIGFSFAIKSRAGTAMTIIGYGIGWAVIYYIMNAVLQALGRAGSVPPEVATILPAIVFTGIAVWLLRRSYQWHA